MRKGVRVKYSLIISYNLFLKDETFFGDIDLAPSPGLPGVTRSGGVSSAPRAMLSLLLPPCIELPGTPRSTELPEG